MEYILFLLGFAVLIKGADFLVHGASSIARQLRVSDLFIGLTVVAFGTSLPELFVNLVASVENRPAIAIGNIIGSNIANILLILGISSLIFPLSITRGTTWKEIPLAFLVAIMLGIMANDRMLDKAAFSSLTRIDGLIFIAFFIIFIYYLFGLVRKGEASDTGHKNGHGPVIKLVLTLISGFALLFVGGVLVVNQAVIIAQRLGISESFIGLTIIALGTSMPELATSAVAACRKNSEIAVGNVVGSNIFNILFILGMSAVIRPLPFTSSDNIDIIVLLGANLLLFSSIFTGKKYKIDRAEGAVFLALYIAYLGYLLVRR